MINNRHRANTGRGSEIPHGGWLHNDPVTSAHALGVAPAMRHTATAPCQFTAIKRREPVFTRSDPQLQGTAEGWSGFCCAVSAPSSHVIARFMERNNRISCWGVEQVARKSCATGASTAWCATIAARPTALFELGQTLRHLPGPFPVHDQLLDVAAVPQRVKPRVPGLVGARGRCDSGTP